jgi:hypothetical protein
MAIGFQRTILQEDCDSSKCTALFIAARHGHNEAVSLLVTAGAAVNHKDEVNMQMSLNEFRVEHTQ